MFQTKRTYVHPGLKMADLIFENLYLPGHDGALRSGFDHAG
jgi:hypothetical protein